MRFARGLYRVPMGFVRNPMGCLRDLCGKPMVFVRGSY